MGCREKRALLTLDEQAAEGKISQTARYGYREFERAEGFVYGIASEWEMRPVGKVSINFGASSENTCYIALTIRDSSERVLGATGLLPPGSCRSELQLKRIPNTATEISITIDAYDEQQTLLYQYTHHEILRIAE